MEEIKEELNEEVENKEAETDDMDGYVDQDIDDKEYMK